MEKKLKKILQFEDETMLRSMYEVKFKNDGFEYVGYDHPLVKSKDAIALVLEEKPDLIITDIIHPGMNGLTFLKLVKTDSRTKDIPVILLTNIGQQEDIDKGMQLGAIKYLVTANITPSEVVDEVRKFFGLPLKPKPVQPTVAPPANYIHATFAGFHKKDENRSHLSSNTEVKGSKLSRWLKKLF